MSALKLLQREHFLTSGKLHSAMLMNSVLHSSHYFTGRRLVIGIVSGVYKAHKHGRLTPSSIELSKGDVFEASAANAYYAIPFRNRFGGQPFLPPTVPLLKPWLVLSSNYDWNV